MSKERLLTASNFRHLINKKSIIFDDQNGNVYENTLYHYSNGKMAVNLDPYLDGASKFEIEEIIKEIINYYKQTFGYQ